MSDELRKRASERRPVGLQIRLAFGDEVEFVERYATNISDGGIFIRSRDRRPVGSRLSFELRLRTGEVVFAGEGTVRWVQGLDHRGLGVPGMGLQFDSLTDESRAVLQRIVERRAGEGLPEPVEGANPASWRPLDEFPPPPVEEPEVVEEPKAPPVLAPLRTVGDPRPAAPVAPRPFAPPVSLATPNVAGLREQIPAAAPVDANLPPPPVLAPVVAPARALPIPQGAAPAPPVMVPVRPKADPAPADDGRSLTAGVLAPVLVPMADRQALAALGLSAAPSEGEDRPERTLPLVSPARGHTPRGWPAPRLAFAGAVGIDFGWSSVRFAACESDAATPLELVEGGALPALVAEQGDGFVVGTKAREAMFAGARGARGVVRLLGQLPSAFGLAPWRRRNLVELAAGPDGRAGVRFGARVHPAPALVEALLAEAKGLAEKRLGGAIDRAAMAVPAHLGDAARRALRDAAAATGLVLDRLVPAPAAAVLAAFGVTGKRRVLTVDFGEGALEAAVVEQAGHVVEIVACGADPDLGLADVDLVVIDSLLTQFERETGYAVPEDFGVFERVRDGAARVRDALGDQLDYELVLPELIDAGLSKAELRQRVTRARHQVLCAAHVDRAFEAVRAVLASRGFGGADLDAILLLGGGTRTSPLARRLSEKLGREAQRPEFPREIAACGAAIVAMGAAGVERHVVQSVVGASIGVGLAGGQMKRVLERHQSVPIERGFTTATTDDHQASVELHLFQGERPAALENDYLGVVTVGPLPRALRGDVRVTVLLSVNDDGELSVRARDAGSGRDLPAMLDRARTLQEAKAALA